MSSGHLSIIELLLAHGARPDFAPLGGKTPLMFAAMFHRLEIVKCLQARDVAMDTRSSEGLTAVDLARRTNATETIAHLELREDHC